jgi:hypothetical protein
MTLCATCALVVTREIHVVAITSIAFRAVCLRCLGKAAVQLCVDVVADEASIPDLQSWMEEMLPTTILPGVNLPAGRDQSLSCTKMRTYIAGIIVSGTSLLNSIGNRTTEYLDLSDLFGRKGRDRLAIEGCSLLHIRVP